MNAPVAEAAKPQEALAQTPAEEKSPDIIAFLKNESGDRTPITKGQVEVVFVRDRHHMDHCLVEIDDPMNREFVKASPVIMEGLLEAGATHSEVSDLPVDDIVKYARCMARIHGDDPMPELILLPSPPEHASEEQSLQLS